MLVWKCGIWSSFGFGIKLGHSFNFIFLALTDGVCSIVGDNGWGMWSHDTCSRTKLIHLQIIIPKTRIQTLIWKLLVVKIFEKLAFVFLVYSFDVVGVDEVVCLVFDRPHPRSLYQSSFLRRTCTGLDFGRNWLFFGVSSFYFDVVAHWPLKYIFLFLKICNIGLNLL